MEEKFIHLHFHSHYSLLDGLPKIDDILKRAKTLNMNAVAITDHGVLYSAVEFYKKAKVAGIKPIIGCEFYIAPEGMLNKRPNIDDKRHHLILLVKNETGYKNLVKLITKAHLEGFYYKPRTDNDLLEKHTEGLIALTACIQGQIPRAIINNKKDEAIDLAKKYQKMFGENNFYLEIQEHPNIPEQDKANQGLIELSKELNIPLVATNDCHYLEKDDAKAQDILMQVNTGAKSGDKERLSMMNEDFSMKPPQEMFEFFIDSELKNLVFNPAMIKDDISGLPTGIVAKPTDYDNFINRIFDLWLKKDDPKIEIRQIKSVVHALIGGKYRSCRFKSECQKYPTIECNGDIFSCDGDEQNKNIRFGNIRQGLNHIFSSEIYKEYRRKIQRLRISCLDCQWYKICRGGCTRDYCSRSQELPKNYFCEGMKEVYQHISDSLKYYKILPL